MRRQRTYVMENGVALKVTPRGTIKYSDYMAARMRNPGDAAGYLSACLEDGDPGVFRIAFMDVINANGGAAAVARKSGFQRKHLDAMLVPNGNSRLEDLIAILKKLGFTMSFSAKPTAKRRPNSKRRKAA